jgi:hypothetical protein
MVNAFGAFLFYLHIYAPKVWMDVSFFNFFITTAVLLTENMDFFPRNSFQI